MAVGVYRVPFVAFNDRGERRQDQVKQRRAAETDLLRAAGRVACYVFYRVTPVDHDRAAVACFRQFVRDINDRSGAVVDRRSQTRQGVAVVVVVDVVHIRAQQVERQGFGRRSQAVDLAAVVGEYVPGVVARRVGRPARRVQDVRLAGLQRQRQARYGVKQTVRYVQHRIIKAHDDVLAWIGRIKAALIQRCKAVAPCRFHQERIHIGLADRERIQVIAVDAYRRVSRIQQAGVVVRIKRRIGVRQCARDQLYALVHRHRVDVRRAGYHRRRLVFCRYRTPARREVHARGCFRLEGEVVYRHDAGAEGAVV